MAVEARLSDKGQDCLSVGKISGLRVMKVSANRWAVVLETGRGRNYRRVYFSYYPNKLEAQAACEIERVNQAQNIGGTGRFNVVASHNPKVLAQ